MCFRRDQVRSTSNFDSIITFRISYFFSRDLGGAEAGQWLYQNNSRRQNIFLGRATLVDAYIHLIWDLLLSLLDSSIQYIYTFFRGPWRTRSSYDDCEQETNDKGRMIGAKIVSYMSKFHISENCLMFFCQISVWILAQGESCANEVSWHSGVVLEKVAEYFYYNYKNRNKEDVPDMEIPPELCLELLMAADYLDSEFYLETDRYSANWSRSMMARYDLIPRRLAGNILDWCRGVWPSWLQCPSSSGGLVHGSQLHSLTCTTRKKRSRQIESPAAHRTMKMAYGM